MKGREEGRIGYIKRTINLQKPVLFLLILRNVNLMNVVIQPQFLEGNAEFLAVRGSGRVPVLPLVISCMLLMDVAVVKKVGSIHKVIECFMDGEPRR